MPADSMPRNTFKKKSWCTWARRLGWRGENRTPLCWWTVSICLGNICSFIRHTEGTCRTGVSKSAHSPQQTAKKQTIVFSTCLQWTLAVSSRRMKAYWKRIRHTFKLNSCKFYLWTKIRSSEASFCKSFLRQDAWWHINFITMSVTIVAFNNE